MFIKVVDNSAWDFNEPKSELIKIASNGLIGNDRREFVKRAGASLLDKVDDIKFKDGEVPVHLIALGATEFYGPNRNGDGFSKKACKDYHHYFVKDARFYRNHKNTDKSKSYGIVKASAYNEKMNRVELIVALNGTEKAAKANGGLVADKEMEKLGSGKDVSVSMACTSDPKYPILTQNKGYIAIEDIRPGDLVWTKDSGWKPVTQINRREYTGDLYKLHFVGLPFPLEITADHLMAARVNIKRSELINKYNTEWVAAENLNVKDYIITKPVVNYSGCAAFDSEELAVILGYYLAEGSTHYTHGEPTSSVEFTCNINDELLNLLPKVLKVAFPILNVHIHPRTNSKVALGVHVHNKDFAALLDRYIGHGVRNKRIPAEIFNAEENIKLAFLSAWMDGDGFCDYKGGHWSTCNPNLALQCRDLLLTIGVKASIYKIDHSKCATSGMPNSGDEYTINIARSYVSRFAKYSKKARDYKYEELAPQKLSASLRDCGDGTFAYKIKKIEKRYIVNTVVYNFEVADDPSYSAAGLVSHNCRVPYDVCSYCGNKAVTRADYCDDVENGGHCKAGGLKHNMCKTASVDGKIVRLYADNTKPMFFDISNVVIPADRIAYTSGIVKKASSEVISGAELAELYGLYESGSQKRAGYSPMDSSYYDSLRCLNDAVHDFHSGEIWKKQAGFTNVVDKEPMRFVKTANAYPYALVVDALNRERHCLTPTQYLELTMDAPREKVAAIAEIIAPLSNEKFAEFIVEGDTANPYISRQSTVPDTLANWAAMQKCATWKQGAFVKQAAKNAFFEETRQFSPNYVYSMQSNDDVDTLCRDYAMYKVAFIHSLPANEKQEMANYLVSRDYMSF